MTKKELKDIILKTLEKEGGAAGLKALTKASKTSKGKLKKSLAKMTGVKQHQDGDYISTPINEVETIGGISLGSSEGCFCGCPPGYDTPFGTGSVAYGAGGQGCPSACSACCAKLVDMCSPSGGTTETGGEYFDTKDNTIAVIGPDSRMPGFREPRKPMPRKPMRLREEETDPPPQAPPFCHYCYKQGCACNRSRGCVNGVGDMSGCGQNPPDFVPTGISNDTWNSSGVYVTITYKKPDKKLREVKEQIFEMITEKLCKKGKAYIAKRKRAGEKSSAYLSGRAVKVCKGQMKG